MKPTSGRFELIEAGHGPVGSLPDTGPVLTPSACQAILHWLRAGETVRYVRDETATPAPAPARATRTVAGKPRAAKKDSADQPSMTDFPDDSRWHQGDRVYLVWSHLADYLKVNLSTYRTTPGIVEAYRTGSGVSKNYGVRFNGDPELTWLSASEISSVAEIG